MHIKMDRLIWISAGLLIVLNILTMWIGTSIFFQILTSMVGMTLILMYILFHKTLYKHILKHDVKALIILCIYIIMELSFHIKNARFFDTAYLFSTLLIFTGLGLLLLRLSTKKQKTVTIILCVFLAAYYIGQDVYYRIFHDYFSVKEIVTAREGAESSEGMYQFEWFHVWIVFLSLSGVLYSLSSSFKKGLLITKKGWKTLSLYPLLLFMLLMSQVTLKKEEIASYHDDLYLYHTVYHRTQFVNTYGTAHFILRDLLDGLIPNISFANEKAYLDAYFETAEIDIDPHAYMGLFEDKNIIFILAESYDELALSEALTPHIYKLKTEGIDFQNHYTPVYQRTTSDTEYIWQTGLIPSIEDGPTSFVYNRNSYHTSLAYLFEQKGYHTQAFHGNYKEFYTRHLLYDGYGYQSFHGQNELGLNEIDKKYDTRFFEEAKHLIAPTTEPFMSFVISLSGHSPYSMNHPVIETHIDQVEAYYGDTLPQSVKYYIATQIELDLMIGLLLDDLTQKGLLSDTVIVFSGDHYPYTLNQPDFESVTLRTEIHDKQRGNLYIWHENITSYDVTKLTSSFDVLPTLASLFNLDYEPSYYVGKDAFTDLTSYVYFKDYTVFDGDRLYQLSRFDKSQISLYDAFYHTYKRSRYIQRSNYFKS